MYDFIVSDRTLSLCLLSSSVYNCARCECLQTTTCHIAVVVSKQGHAPYKLLLLQHSLFNFIKKTLEKEQDWIEENDEKIPDL